MDGGSLCAERHRSVKTCFLVIPFKSMIKQLLKVGVYVLTPKKTNIGHNLCNRETPFFFSHERDC